MERTDDIKPMDELISSAQWSSALLFMKAKKNSELSISEKMNFGLIYFNLHQYEEGFNLFETLSWDNYKDCTWLRRKIIAPLMTAKKHTWAIELLKLILSKHPLSVLDLMTLSSLLIRENKRSEACIHLEHILTIETENYGVAAQLIQLKLQDNKLDQAVQLAKDYEYAYELNERLFKLALLTLSKAKELQFCIKKITTIDYSKQSLEIGLTSAQIALDAHNNTLAQDIIYLLQKLGYKDARIGFILAKSKLSVAGNESDAISILTKANELDPDNIQINSLLGDLLLKEGKYSQALHHLEILKVVLPKNPHTRMLNARALKYTGAFDQAAEEMLAVVQLLPESAKWKRYAAAALAQAGRYEEAKNIFEEGIIVRDKKLPESFEAGLRELWDKIDSVTLPQARFDWLWSMITKVNGENSANRTEYEKFAKWGYLLDHFLLDWLECRPNQSDEAMAFFEDLSNTYSTLKNKLDEGNGVILVSAHIGLLYAVPLALELLGLPHKWLASTPKIASIPYNDNLISTGEQTETEVVRQIIKAQRQGDIIALAVDGAMNPSAPKIDFENQKITYSDFAAKMAYRTGSPTYFITSFWENNNFSLKLIELTAPLSTENMEEFCSRWTQEFLNTVRNFLVTSPSNSRLSGGIWRAIRAC